MKIVLEVERGSYHNRAEALELVEALIRRYGSNLGAARAVADRFGMTVNGAERLLLRIRKGPQRYVTESTLDRLSVMV